MGEQVRYAMTYTLTLARSCSYDEAASLQYILRMERLWYASSCCDC
jgi:hypothetical protein